MYDVYAFMDSHLVTDLYFFTCNQNPHKPTIVFQFFPKEQFSVDTKHILTYIPFICISSTDNNPIIYLQAVTETIVLSQQGLCFTWSGGD